MHSLSPKHHRHLPPSLSLQVKKKKKKKKKMVKGRRAFHRPFFFLLKASIHSIVVNLSYSVEKL
jgi:hypothetical protein